MKLLEQVSGFGFGEFWGSSLEAPRPELESTLAGFQGLGGGAFLLRGQNREARQASHSSLSRKTLRLCGLESGARNSGRARTPNPRTFEGGAFFGFRVPMTFEHGRQGFGLASVELQRMCARRWNSQKTYIISLPEFHPRLHPTVSHITALPQHTSGSQQLQSWTGRL